MDGLLPSLLIQAQPPAADRSLGGWTRIKATYYTTMSHVLIGAGGGGGRGGEEGGGVGGRGGEGRGEGEEEEGEVEEGEEEEEGEEYIPLHQSGHVLTI